MSWVAVAIAGSAALTAGIGAATQPDAPDYARVNREGIEADIETAPIRRMIENAARSGTKVDVPNFDGSGGTPIFSNISVSRSDDHSNRNWIGREMYKGTDGNWYHPEQVKTAADGSKYVQGVQTGTTPTTKTYDFTGQGDADFQADYARKLVEAGIKLDADYGNQLIDRRLEQVKRADPEGAAARDRLFAETNRKFDEAPDTEISDRLRAEILAQINQGGTLDPEIAREVANATNAQQVARGNTMGNAAIYEHALNTGTAGEARKNDRFARAVQFITSGATPEDIKYRKFQQDLGNLSSVAQGTSPLAQFQALSSAGNGPVQSERTTNLSPPLNPNAGAQAGQFAQQNYNTQANMPNPWIQGIGVGLSAGGLAMQARKPPTPRGDYRF